MAHRKKAIFKYCKEALVLAFQSFPGDDAGRATPVPIPNTEVKPSRADGTAGATLWESRKSPGFFREDNNV